MDIQSIKARFGIIGNAPALNHALQVAGQVAATDLTVLIAGESGVGKEVFSNVIHSLSSRKHNPFIAVNCGAIPEGTIDSELFGHEKGSFTGAVDSRKGYFEAVNGGTIFLDEIGELPLGTQARLLRVLETGEYIRVGSSKVQKTNVRVIAATNRDLLDHTGRGKFREDLYYRLSTVPIRVPSLRNRKEDIPLLFRKFAGDFAEKYRTQSVQLDSSAQQLLINYPWPGNVRELKNIAEQVSVLSTSKLINGETLAEFLPEHSSNLPVPSPSPPDQRGPTTNTERDILYQLFFDVKKDMNEIKTALFEMAHGGFAPARSADSFGKSPMIPNVTEVQYSNPTYGQVSPVLVSSVNTKLDPHDDVEESLSLTDREKELIVKALKKHKGRRKDAAHELGISERTLYRKIKEYDIEE